MRTKNFHFRKKSSARITNFFFGDRGIIAPIICGHSIFRIINKTEEDFWGNLEKKLIKTLQILGYFKVNDYEAFIVKNSEVLLGGKMIMFRLGLPTPKPWVLCLQYLA